ncbi:MAG: hypothetical protein J07HB67_01124 [halophilic archaeon J07HB67]|jgi:hypothetical protein|nr:MAG: hypothetical protein J07HB67_01124 [halophilic archaeon J07HB67]
MGVKVMETESDDAVACVGVSEADETEETDEDAEPQTAAD